MTANKSYDVMIIGAGMVGAAMALALRHLPLRVALVDSHEPSAALTTNLTTSVHSFSPRVSALTSASLGLLDDLEIRPQIERMSQAYQQMHVWDELGTARVKFDAAELGCPALGEIAENTHVLSAMHAALNARPSHWSMSWAGHWGSALRSLVRIDEGYQVRLDDEVFTARLVLGADGANSKVRQLAGLPTREWDYEHQAIVCTVETEQSHGAIARQRFSEAGPLAFLPLRDSQQSGRFSSIVWSLETYKARRYFDLDDQAFSLALGQAIETELGEVSAVSKRVCFPLRQRHAKDYVLPGVALIGDAAHTIHPLAGQGVNLGFKDVACLARLIEDAHRNGTSFSHLSLLKRYQRERQGDNLLMMGAMEGFKQLFGSPNPLVRWARNTGLNFVNQQALIKAQLAKHAMGI